MQLRCSWRSVLVLTTVAVLALAGCPKPKPPPVDDSRVDTGPHYDGPEPLVRSVAPDTATEGELVDLSVEGEYFRQGVEVYVGRTRAGNVSLPDGESIRCTAPTSLSPGVYDIRVVNTDTSEARLERAFRVERSADCALQRVYFDYDRSELSGESRSMLEANAECIQSKDFRSVTIEGHADERGETEYNMALGQRRADSVRKYLINLGVNGSVLKTISYGEEKPLQGGAGEVTWSKNRRAELIAQ